jgi:hypothetical protein
MKQIKQIFNWWLTALFLMTFLSGNALATKPLIGPRAHIEYAEPVKIGERALIPVHIDFLPHIKSGVIKFELDASVPLQEGVKASSVKTEEVVLDLSKITSYPYIAYVPVTVTDEGRFDFKGTLHIEMVDGEKLFDNLTSFDYPLSRLGIFAFDGEVFFGGNSELAIKNKAHYNLQKNNAEYDKLFLKRQKINDGASKGQTLSKEEEEKLRKLIDEEDVALRKRYCERHPIKIEPTSKLLKPALRHNSDFVLFTICDMKCIKSSYIFDYFFKGGKTKTYIGV